ncbi:sugar phosphate isomerase/epimerase and 4-hydroxyphenylpyruvate domain-containing protein [Gephyromycinifex aptenodytis]|uniref:sugar phosphate isomerase/epimerase and 4-hydroxyphenylpyruvate domain-containing protein n=1 Tax=Gephyromycinifex aptenodytis TaxID=2716227 RepID=UPI001444C8DF|nr:sugar phosphate isomerase/epimerase and 4-hydroxyphenylpyruvate domain-containing protein [Gephyromycinifex aptenodytis]
MRKAIATVSLSGQLEDKLAAIAAARFDGIELFDNDLIAATSSPREVAHRCRDLGLSIELFQPLRDIEGWDPARFEPVRRRLRKKFAVMEELGVHTALACSNALPSAIDDLDLSAEQLHAVGEVAHEHGIVIAFEALAWGRHIDRVGQAWEAVRRADHPCIGLAVDTFHILSRGDGPQALAEVPGSRILYMQIADAPRLDMNVLSWSRHFRCFPGQGNLEVAALVSAVVEAGYRGPLSLEVFSDVVRTAHPRQTALDGMRSLLHLEEEMRALSGAKRPRVDLFDPPPLPARVDAGFVEFAVEPEDQIVRPLLSALGFTHVGEHATRPVQWWRNGEAHVCVTTLPVPDAEEAPRSRPFVSALALITDDVQDVATRARALLWPEVRKARGRYQAALPGIDTPDGLHVFLSSPGGHAQDWRAGYTPLEPAAEEVGDWLGIDHLTVSVPADRLPSEQSFYRTVFGLQAGEITEFIQPSGRLRSRPLRPAAGNLRVILSASEDNRDNAARGIEQIAFACPDVEAAVRRARAAGVRFLDVPENYYVDLDSRVELEPEYLARLRECGLLYDRDDQGAFIHAYTQVINGAFHIELTQRIGGYDEYGAPAAHVRLAAHERG